MHVLAELEYPLIACVGNATAGEACSQNHGMSCREGLIGIDQEHTVNLTWESVG